MIRGKFQAQDDFDLAGHRLLNWKWLNDIPTADAEDGQVLAYIGGDVVWATATSEGVVSVAWDDITGKPSKYPPEDHTHPWDEVTGKPTFVNSITAGLGIAISSTTGNVQISNSIQADQTEPTGFIDTPGTYTSTMVATDNRTFSIGPDSGEDSFSFYVKGVKYTKTATESITFPDTEGIHAFYYDDTGTLNTTLTPLDSSIFTENALCAVLRWDSSEGAIIYFGEERHGIVMDGKTHQYLHDTEGTRMIGGHALSDINADASGDLDSSATLSVEAGTIADEDLFLSAAATTNATQTWYTYFKTDTGDWVRVDTGNFPIRVTASATPTYNLFSGGTWSQSNIGNLQYVLAHIYRTNSTTMPYIAVQGENSYIGVAAAREGAADELNQLTQSGMPFVEFHPLGTLIYEHRTSYANSIRARIRTTDTGDNYVDWRFQALTPGAGPSDHGSLSGLTDKDHPTTALQQTGAVTGQVIEWDGADWVPGYHVNSLSAGYGINISTSIEDITISVDTTSVITAINNGSNIEVSGSTVNVVTNPTFGGDVEVVGTLDVTGQITATGNILGLANIYADYNSADGRCEINVQRRGFSVDLANETGGWARGFVFYDNTTLLGGFQGYGTTGAAVARLSMAPEYTDPNGIHLDMSSGYVNIGTITSQGARLTVYSRTEADPIIANFITNNQDAKVRIGQIGSDYGFYWKYEGTGAGNANAIGFWAENQAGTDVQVWTCNQSGLVTFLEQLTFDKTVTFNSTIAVTGGVYASSYYVGTGLLAPDDLDGSGYSSGDVPTWNATTGAFAAAAPGGVSGASNLRSDVLTVSLDITNTTVPNYGLGSLSLAADTYYQFEVVAYYKANGTPDIRLHTNVPAGTTFIPATGYNNLGGALLSWNTGTDVRINGAGWSDSLRRFAMIKGLIITGSTAGTWSVSWAQNTANSGTSTMLAGSHIKLITLKDA